ncbi:MAG: ImmA/IrrE family metallo-endopeptidase [Acidimicrobiales bacterium]
METRRAPTVESIAAALLEHVSEEVRSDLRSEQPASAVELYFGPIGCQALPCAGITRGSCSIDGYYTSDVDPKQPWIFYANDVHEDRIRFTVLHELGHHLIVTVADSLLDDLDVVGGSAKGAIQAEETVCHRFAGNLLVPNELLNETIGGDRILPEHVVAIHELGAASWEACAVRIAEIMPVAGAVVLLRDSTTVAFCAASSRMGSAWWPRGCRLDPNGPLARGLNLRQTAQPEQYRFGLGYPRTMFCDTLPVHDGLAIGVLSDKPSDGSLSIIEQAELAWKERVQFCEWCHGVERDRGWCYRCSGPYCPECDRCGCGHPVQNPLCPSCGLLNPARPGASMCRDCETDLG